MDISFNEACISIHNELRALHKAPPLTYSKELAEDAQQWAEYLGVIETLRHSETAVKQGENLAASRSRRTPENYVFMWYREIYDYKFGQERQDIHKIGHFSQVVWLETREAGFGIVKSARHGRHFVVGRYKPNGNILGCFNVNVSPPIRKWVDYPLINKISDYYPDLKNQPLPYFSTRKSSRASGRNINTNNSTSLDFHNNSYTRHSIDYQDNQPQFKERNSAEDIELSIQLDTNLDQTISPDNFRQVVLATHNSYRLKHNVDNLKLNPELCEKAEIWAISLAKSCQLNYSNYWYNNQEIGENIAVKFCVHNKVKEFRNLIDNWYKEGNNYDYLEENQDISKIGHFTQLIWASTQDLGCGYAVTKAGEVIYVCFYYPAGNIIGQFVSNVNRV